MVLAITKFGANLTYLVIGYLLIALLLTGTIVAFNRATTQWAKLAAYTLLCLLIADTLLVIFFSAVAYSNSYNATRGADCVS